MRRQVPLAITFIVGVLIVAQYFIPHWPFNQLFDTLNTWYMIVLFFAVTLGIGNLIKLHTRKVQRKAPGWGFSIVLVGSLDERNYHLRALMAIAQIAQETDFEKKWLEARNIEELRDVILLSSRKRDDVYLGHSNQRL